LPAYKTAYITLTDQEKVANNFTKGDTEGIVNYALSIEGVVMAAIFIEDKEQEIIKISFRSKGTFSVNQFARDNFSGGGHDNAAGGKSDLSMDETIKKFNSLLPRNKVQLIDSYEV
jgi:phosphoesterase RecJ-like protein